MIRYSTEAAPAVDADVEAAFDWYEGEERGLGIEFLEELRVAYSCILGQPFGYQELRSGTFLTSLVRRGLRITAGAN